MKKYKLLPYLCILLLFIVSCTSEQDYYEIPVNEDGEVEITQVSETTSDGITTLDDEFTVTSYLPNAASGDVVTVELLKMQGDDEDELLALDGTEKEVTVGSDLTITVTYSRSETQLEEVGDYVDVAINGETESGLLEVDLEQATTVSGPYYDGTEVTIMDIEDTAYFSVSVLPISFDFTDEITVKRRNGSNSDWIEMGGFSNSSDNIPVSGNFFAEDQDTLLYLFIAQNGSYIDSIEEEIIIVDPYFFVENATTLNMQDSTEEGVNLLNNEIVGKNSSSAIIAIDGSSTLQGGSEWLAQGYSIEFVESTSEMYDANNSESAIEAFAAGTATATVDPTSGDAVYIFKITNGTEATDIYYGILEVTSIVPNSSVTFSYRIGNKYAHINVVE